MTFAKRGWRTYAVTRAGTLWWPRFSRGGNLTVVEVPGFGHARLGALLYLVVGVALGVIWGLRTRAFLAIQLVSPTSVASLSSLIVGRPFVCMATATGALGELHYVGQTRLARVRLWLLRRATFVVAQNPEQATALATVIAPDRVTTVPNPVEIPATAPLNGRARVLFTGRFSAEKDLVGLIECWREMVTDRRDLRLTLVGDGGSFRSVERELRSLVAADPALMETVSFEGWVPDVTRYLLSHDVYVFPSLTEGMSNALLEAAAYRRIVVASDIPGNRAVLGDDYPLYFAAGDRAGLLAALHLALEDEQTRRKARDVLGARTAAFAPDEIVQRLESLIEDAAHRPRH